MRSRRRAALLALCAVQSACAAPRHSTAGPPTVTAAATVAGTVLLADQATVDGTVTSAHVVDAVGPVLPVPLTITVPERGHGAVRIRAGGETIAWDGGQPLPLLGTGALDLGPATVDIDLSGITWHLDGAGRVLVPGRYVADSPVAVGTLGLARPEDSAAFTVAPATQGGLVSNGDARIHVPVTALFIKGPGNMTLSGSLTVHTASTTRIGQKVTFGRGPFELRLTPAAGGFSISALLQGPITVQ